MKKQTGFSLIELVATIALMGIVASTVSLFIAGPINHYVQIANRTKLISLSQDAMRQVTRDVRGAAPSSVRISADGKTMELLHVREGFQYYTNSEDADDNIVFDGLYDASPAAGTRKFRIVGQASERGTFTTDYLLVSNTASYISGNVNNPRSGLNAYARNAPYSVTVQGPTGPANQTAYGHVLYQGAFSICDGAAPQDCGFLTSKPNTDAIFLSTAHKFVEDAFRHQVFQIDTAITYHCDLTEKTLKKITHYPLSPTMGVPPTNGTTSLVANELSHCNFLVDAPTGGHISEVVVSLGFTTRDNQKVELREMASVRNDL